MLHEWPYGQEEKPFRKQIILSETDKILLITRRVKKRITFLAIVGITMIEGKEHQIVRYDLSHDFLHKDLLFDPKGGKEKIFEKVDGTLITRITQETINEFGDLKRKYLMKIRIRKESNEGD